MPKADIPCSSDTLILPGLNGSFDGHWQWHWARDNAGARDNPGARVVEQANWACPDLDAWKQRLDETLTAFDGVWIVAHSLGCILAANLATSPLASRIKGALLVAPCDLEAVERLHPCAVNFGTMPAISLPFRSVVVGSLDDPYMDFDTTTRMARLWGSELIDLGHAGHINVRSGYGRWPRGYRLMDQLKAGGRLDPRIQPDRPKTLPDTIAPFF